MSDWFFNKLHSWYLTTNAAPRREVMHVVDIDNRSSGIRVVPNVEYTWTPSSVSSSSSSLRIVCISDTHGKHEMVDVPPGDVLIHAGDIALMSCIFTSSDMERKYIEFNQWLSTLPHAKKIVIAGNHDTYLEKIGAERAQSLLSSATYLEYSSTTYKGIKFFGSPRSEKKFSINQAYQVPNYTPHGSAIHALSSAATEGDVVDVFISHQSPPCDGMLRFMQATDNVRVYVCGHMHGNHGRHVLPKVSASVLTVCSMDEHRRPWQAPVVFDITPRRKEPTK
eukprot:PhM_4_TR7321/c0_g1_i1/m.583